MCRNTRYADVLNQGELHDLRLLLLGQPLDNLFSRQLATKLSQIRLASFFKVRSMPIFHGRISLDAKSVAKLGLQAQGLVASGGMHFTISVAIAAICVTCSKGGTIHAVRTLVKLVHKPRQHSQLLQPILQVALLAQNESTKPQLHRLVGRPGSLDTWHSALLLSACIHTQETCKTRVFLPMSIKLYEHAV